MSSLPGFSLAVNGPTFNEFALRLRKSSSAMTVVERLRQQNLLAGVPIAQPGYALPQLADSENVLLVAVSERHSREDIDRLARALDEVCP